MKYQLSMFFFCLLALTEGISLMGVEIISMRLLSTYYGNSLSTYTTVIGLTMLGLAIGYYLGAIFSKRDTFSQNLINLLFGISLLIIIMPGLSYLSLKFFYQKPLGAPISCLFFLFPVTCGLGMLGPLAIQNITGNITFSGKYTGRFYALSSIGGMVTAFVLGFFIMEKINIVWTLIGLGLLLSLYSLAIIVIWNEKKYLAVALSTIILGWIMVKNINLYDPIKPEEKKLNEIKDGMLGQIIVEDHYEKSRKIRFLFLDKLPQSTINPFTKISYNFYVHKISSLASNYPANSNSLVLGTGGGSLVIELVRLGMKVDAVELDQNIKEAGEKYFGLSEFEFNYFIDDARHYINRCNKLYELIVIDIISGENPPAYLFTKESFEQLYKLLKPDGSIFLYFTGPMTGKNAIGLNSIMLSLEKNGFIQKIYFEKKHREGVKVIVSTANQRFREYDNDRMNICCRKYLSKYVEYMEKNYTPGEVLLDDRPVMDIYFRKSIPDFKVRTLFWKTF